MACLNLAGKQPVAKDALKSRAMNEERMKKGVDFTGEVMQQVLATIAIITR